MKHFLALAATLFAFHAPVMGASSEELVDIRVQLHNLLERVDRLERENDALRAQNETLQVTAEDLKSETGGLRDESARQVDGVNAAGWAVGVVRRRSRYRHEQIRDDTRDASGGRLFWDSAVV